MDELALINAAQNDDLDAFNRLILAHQELAFNVACRILVNPDAAEDAVQESFISAYNSLSSFRGGSFKAWLLRVVTNKCYDELRRQKRRPETELNPIIDDSGDEIESPTWLEDDAPSPEEHSEQALLAEAIEECISRLPENFRIVAVMIDVQDFEYQEVAKAIGKPLGTVKSRLARARHKLRDCLAHFRELWDSEFRLEDEVSV
ncbi:MAG: sigma-70 family RNA polymerase sigma factor [Anaerolineaceae bacterium]|jgi:RNA polymerase sigma-70 factor (ECF subfamily)|nr:sigma-70 family RNA polymerase sigma factor [Anaerolineaceae bacterium]